MIFATYCLGCSIQVKHVGGAGQEDGIDSGVAAPRLRLGPPTTSRRPNPLRVLKVMSSAHIYASLKTRRGIKRPEMYRGQEMSTSREEEK